jgi:hypothetical protein
MELPMDASRSRRWTRIAAIAVALVVVGLGSACARGGSGGQQPRWEAPAGYEKVDELPVGPAGERNYLWISEQGEQHCWIVEAADKGQKHLGAVSACRRGPAASAALSRVLKSLVGSVPIDDADSVIVKRAWGEEIARARVHQGFFITVDQAISSDEVLKLTTVGADGKELSEVEVRVDKAS